MKSRGVVTGQRVAEDKVALARELRRDPTPAEHLVWQRLKANRLGGLHFRRQQVIDGFIVDFYCHSAGLVVEVDGPVHLRQMEEDARRDKVLSGRGLRVLRITNDEVRTNLDVALGRILSAIGASPSL